MRMSLLALWAIVLFGGWAYHEGPGQDAMVLDDVDRSLREAYAFATDEQWPDAVKAYDEALKMLPAGHERDAWRIRLERSKAQMLASQLPQAHADLAQLVDELVADGDEPELLTEARSAEASAQYYMTWLMRLEGMPREKWEPEIEAARQTYRLLAEEAEKSGNSDALEKNREDLESAIRLARMELKDLQGLPLPSQ